MAKKSGLGITLGSLDAYTQVAQKSDAARKQAEDWSKEHKGVKIPGYGWVQELIARLTADGVEQEAAELAVMAEIRGIADKLYERSQPREHRGIDESREVRCPMCTRIVFSEKMLEPLAVNPKIMGCKDCDLRTFREVTHAGGGSKDIGQKVYQRLKATKRRLPGNPDDKPDGWVGIADDALVYVDQEGRWWAERPVQYDRFWTLQQPLGVTSRDGEDYFRRHKLQRYGKGIASRNKRRRKSGGNSGGPQGRIQL